MTNKQERLIEHDAFPREPGKPTGRRRRSVEQESFGPGKDAPDPNELAGDVGESPWAKKGPGSNRPY